jgi:Na(+)-translocating NADH:ubiquinone oxidoreductase F subunit
MQADVIRVDHAGRTYALYRTADDRYYATDGTCTHGNAHLAEGYVTGTLIECPKHNGRFDFRDGSPQRQPVCVGHKTYSVENRGGSLFINFSTAGGFGVTQVPPTYTFRVVSNDNVATYIKELVLELLPGQPKLDYQPGDYLQFDIPAYPETSLQTVAVGAPYAEAWQAQRLFDLTAHNPAPCRRNYSIASNPASEALLRFNVRLATPPLGQGWNTGVGSAYLFGLQPGDQVSAIGPFGDFHIRDTGREMVYLGGGSGMAPLRSHIAYLLESLHTTRKVSYWYGVRAQGDLFYQSYFEDLARRYPNFSFHAALSEPQPYDQWSGHAGFIHAVLQRQYLAAHPDPQAIDFYLCGPPAMIRAAISMLAEYGVGPAQIAYDEF